MNQMEQKKLTDLTDEELLQEAKKMKSRSVLNAAIVGFMTGILVWCAVRKSVGIFAVIPIFVIYRLVNQSKQDKALKQILRERNLK